jgi:hypothetical protein
MIKHSEEFKHKAVRIALSSGLPRARVASDLGVGKSTLGKWVSEYRPTDLVAAPQAFAISAAVFDAIEIVMAIAGFPAQIIGQPRKFALNFDPCVIVHAQIDQQTRLFVTERVNDGHSIHYPANL